MQMYTEVYLCNTILVTEIFCYWYSTIKNLAKKYIFSTKFGNSYRNLLGIKCMKLHSDLFRFDIFIVWSLGGQFFYWTQCSNNCSLLSAQPLCCFGGQVSSFTADTLKLIHGYSVLTVKGSFCMLTLVAILDHSMLLFDGRVEVLHLIIFYRKLKLQLLQCYYIITK